ncbi:hypothetical protein B0H16DRAFT_1527845 [Mycena metata]|uniref:Acetyl-CoA synthetase-like protein n=1 Tax=Mycena metata TaxID=1033252 RepID=A0AAD7NJX1_9AGAR|nr:hypothetical protein B0H16DRAFT_1527845 [Mycena metata]
MKSPLPPHTTPGFQSPESTSLAEILITHAQDNPKHTLFRYVEVDGTLSTISWAQAVQAFDKIARSVRQQLGNADEKPRPFLTITSILTFDQTTSPTFLRAGYPAFPISPRNSPKQFLIFFILPAAHTSSSRTREMIRSLRLRYQGPPGNPDTVRRRNLLGPSGCAPGEPTEPEKIKLVLDDHGIGNLPQIPAPSFEQLFGASTSVDDIPVPSPEQDDVAVILHSSGSVKFTKVIKVSHRSLRQCGLWLDYEEIDVCGQVWSAHNVPTFHFAGVMQLIWAMFSGITLAVFPPNSPAAVPTPARVLDEAIATQTNLLYCVPAFLEVRALERNEMTIEERFGLVSLVGLLICNTAVGDFLSKNGVRLSHIYGLTETGGLSMMIPEYPPTEDYFHLAPHIDPVLVPLPELPDVYRLIVKKCATHTPAILNTMVDGVPALDTNDLLVRHPDNDKLWKVYGREDDQIMHSNGEKTNPGPLEGIILKDPKIKHALMFGRSKFNAGILIFPVEPLDPADTERVADFRRDIWPSIQEANEIAPSHSRIFKEMILIEEIYASVESSSLTHITAPALFDVAASLEFVCKVIAEVMIKVPEEAEDIFQHGCDSLQATWIRNSILHALRRAQISGLADIPHDFVYTHPTIRLLAIYLVQIASGLPSPPSTPLDRTLRMQEMVLKYSQKFPTSSSGIDATEEVVFVTGTAGALGAYLLARLLSQSQFTRVYVFNRFGASIQERQRSSFSTHGIDVGLLTSPKLRLLAGDLTKPTFGLPTVEFEEIRSQVTCIIHNSWQVDFNLSLSSFEPGIHGTRNLVDFALTAPHANPPQFIFVSTVGVYRNFSGTVAPEAKIPDVHTSCGQGYAESKWVCEQILEIAADTTVLRPIIVRSGRRRCEWFPTLLRSSQVLGHLPEIPGCISWLPIDHAAQALVEMRLSDNRYLHLTHPHPVPFAQILALIAEDLHLPVVPYTTWLNSLQAASSSGLDNPGTRLLDFFGSIRAVSDQEEAFFPVPLANENALRNSAFLSSVPALDRRDVTAWVGYLRKVGYLV